MIEADLRHNDEYTLITVTYIITVYNKEKYIAHVINSLKSIRGNFRKEFIIIDDGSTDNSCSIIESASANLPRTIVIKQQNQGPAVAVNQGITLAHGDYIHFVDGDDIIESNATAILLDACKSFGTEVAYGLRGKYSYETLQSIPSKREGGGAYLINNPINAILEGKIPSIRTIGSSGSLVSRNLLEKVSGADINVFVQDMSISLRCAEYSKFAFVPKTVTYAPLIYSNNNLSHNKIFEAYNTLRAIANFTKEHVDIAAKFKSELYRSLWSIAWKSDKYNVIYLFRYIMAKFIDRDIAIEDLQKLYDEQVNKLL